MRSAASARLLQQNPGGGKVQRKTSDFKAACLSSSFGGRVGPAGCAGIRRTWGDVFTATSNQGRRLKKNIYKKKQEAARGRH